ncbi:MAG: 16S rRNA (uracil(1498)-N(3))-methyltransferase [Clostridia bacterium]|nr:16S rRNA (uracil(1498)-N(3))-methyltransferase [Clostridia bacterium]
MPKFFVKSEQIKENTIQILGQDVNHIRKVLRAQIDKKINICNCETGDNFSCRIFDIKEDKIECEIINKVEENVESNLQITIFQGLPKSDKMEYIIQKSVELGVYDIIPVQMRRCVVKLGENEKIKKVNRWQKISEVAAKQSGRGLIPKIENIINISKVCDLIKNYDIVFVAYENELENTLKAELTKIKEKFTNKQKAKIGIIIGPEGGLELEEISKMKEKGAKIITLGKRILRTETVSLNVLSIIMYELEI